MNDYAKINDGFPLEHTPVAKCVQYQIVTGGLIDHPEQRQLLTRIDTLEFSKWEYKTIDQLTSWYGSLGDNEIIPFRDQHRLVLFLNDKLLFRASKAHPHYGSKLCPSCQREPETALHFLMCTHPTRAALFRTLKDALTKFTQKLRLQPYLLTAWWLGLAAYRTGLEYPPIMNDLPRQLQASVQIQTKLGWGQLYQGRVAVTWAQAIDALHPNLAPSGTQVMISMICLVWAYILDVWKTRNQHLHNSANLLNLPDYRQAASTLYELRHQLLPAAQNALYQQPLEQILELPAPRLQRWVQLGYKYFNQQIKSAKKQAALQTPDIRSFFRPHSTQTQPDDDLQPP